MARDKNDTHQKLIQCARREFLQRGYEKASLKSIAGSAGITAAGIYRHFSDKEDLFRSLVEPVTGEFLAGCEGSMEETYEGLGDADFVENFNEFRREKNREFVDFMYDHLDVFQLLLMCSEGTPYENFEQKLVALEEQSVRDLFRHLDSRGIPHNQVTDVELHILCSILIASVCDVIRRGYNREQAQNHLEFLGRMLYPGMKQVLGV